LFDLSTDPNEKQDISEGHPEITQRLSRAMVAAMLPEEDAFHVWIMASHDEEPHRFTGEVRLLGGIRRVQAFSLEEGDSYSVEGDTIKFDILSTLPAMQIDKHLMITPAEGAETLEAKVRVDGRISPDRYYPYGVLEPEPSGFATVHIDDFPLGPNLTAEMAGLPAVCYIWGVRGFSRGEVMAELGPETTEQLRALGYIN
jgi:hypothetical protein